MPIPAALTARAHAVTMAAVLSLAAGSAIVGDCDLAGDARCMIRGVQYELFAPPAGCSAQAPCGLILDVHGGTMSGTEEVKNSKMDELGPAAGYIVIAPTTPDSIVRDFWARFPPSCLL